MNLLALYGPIGTWGIGEYAIAIVAIAAIVALVFIALRKFGIAIPDWIVQIFWVLIVAFVVIAAIRIVMSM